MIVMPAWPPRPAICLDCRTLQPAADRCLASAHHRVADLTSRAGRAALLDFLGKAEGLPPELAKQVAEALADSHRGDVIYLGPAVGLGAGRP